MTLQETMPSSSRTDELRHFEHELDEAQTARREQLDLLPPTEVDHVANLQRATLLQTLEEIDSARQRLADGTFGTCTTCQQPISIDRLDFRPWSATCVHCAGR